MATPTFDDQGLDAQTFAPFTLYNCLTTEWKDVRLSFSDWRWIKAKYKSDTIDDYYMNGYGVEGLVKAALFAADLDPDDEEIDYNSEGDACYIHFKTIESAVRAAELSVAMIKDKKKLTEMIEIARDQGFEDS